MTLLVVAPGERLVVPSTVEQHRYPTFSVILVAVFFAAVDSYRPERLARFGHEHLDRGLDDVREHQYLGFSAPRVRSAHAHAVRVKVSLDEPLHLRASSLELVHSRVPQRVRPRRLGADIVSPAAPPKRHPDRDGAEKAPAVARDGVYLVHVPLIRRGASDRARRRRRAPPRERPGVEPQAARARRWRGRRAMTREGAGLVDRLRGGDPRRGGGRDVHARHVTENPHAPSGRH